MRAYGGVLAAALAAAPRRRGRPAVLLELRYDAERTSAVLRTVAVHGGGHVEHGWEDGRALLRLALPAAAVDRFADGLRGATRGGIDVERRGATVLFDEPAPVTGR